MTLQVRGIAEDYWILQDNTYVATFPRKYGDIIKNRLKLARDNENSKYLETIHDGIQKTWHDKTLGTFDIEPIEVQYKKDKVTMEGMEIFNQNIMLQASTRLNYMAVGSGTSVTYANQQALQSEVARASMDDSGFMRAEGLFLMWENIFDSLVPSFACSEVGVFDASSGGTMAARALLGTPVNHDYGNDWLYVQFFISTLSS
jgi:hypothetical protein